MIENRFINFFLIFIVVNLFFIAIINMDLKNKKTLSLLGCILSFLIIISVCFFPFPMQEELLESMISGNEGVRNNFIPFHSIIAIIKDAVTYRIWSIIPYQILGNIVLFVPFGFSVYFYMESPQKWLKIWFSILFLTCSIEILQGIFNYFLGVNYRAVDIDDILLNMIGGILGSLSATYMEEKIMIRKAK